MIIFSTLFLSMFITLSLIPIFMRYAVRMDCMDEPCTRKVHCAPVPKVGGIAMALGALLPVALAATVDRALGAILLGAGIIVVFGFVDDLRDLGYRAKFTAQLAAAAVVIFWGGVKICCLGGLAPDGFVLPDWLAVPLTLMVIVGVTNAVNLSDGLDGLAGGIMLMSFLCIGFIAYRNGNSVIALLVVAIIGAIFGFLRFNTYPATVFMGDAGSQLLGFLAITLATMITQGNTPVSPVLPLLLLGMPILDTLTVMAERIRNGKSPFLADKNHLHHKLLRLGLFHTESVFTLYVLQGGLVTTAFFLRFHSEWLLLAIYLGFAASVAGFFWAADKKGWRLERPGLLDASVKIRLKILKDRQVVIKVSENMIELLFPLLLIVTCALPAGPPVYLPVVAAGLAVAVALIWLFRPPLVGSSLRVVIYFFLPLVIYYAELQPADWIRPEMMRLYHLAFGVLVFFAVFTLKATRRREGFKLSPLDFIILFVAVLVPNLPDPAIRHFHLGLLAVKIIVIFFVFEVLTGELRGQLKRLGGGIVIALTVLVAKSFLA